MLGRESPGNLFPDFGIPFPHLIDHGINQQFQEKRGKDAGTAKVEPLKCLKAHEYELSAPCNESIKAIQEEKQKTN